MIDMILAAAATEMIDVLGLNIALSALPDGGASTSLYVKEAYDVNDPNAGWVAK